MDRTVTRILVGTRRGMPSSELPVIVRGTGRPVVAVTANVHGDECTGLGLVHALDERLETLPLKGTVVLYPSCNPQGLAAQCRQVPADDADLNRAFPGDPRGTLSARIAAALWLDLKQRAPDVVLDVHADAPRAIPYVIVDRPVRQTKAGRRELSARMLSLAEATGLTVLREYPDDTYVQFALDRSLAGAVVNLLGAPAVTLEIGPRRYLDSEAVEVALAAALGVLAEVGAVEAPRVVHPSRVEGIWRRASSPRARRSGVLVPLLEPGQGFEAGRVLARLRGLTGEVEEEIRATAPGIVVSWVEGGWIAAGGVIGTLGVHDGGRL